MRYAIISDIHGNLEALKKVLRAVKKNGADEIICLGDIVGYGPNPNECVERISERDIRTVAGNHDYAVIDESLIAGFNAAAAQAIKWTISVLTPENQEFLAGLPLFLKVPDVYLVHSTPSLPLEWNYILDPITAMGEMECFEEKFALIGHSHRPAIFTKTGESVPVGGGDIIPLKKDERYIINPGSVGQPRDHCPGASFGILDTDRLTFALFRVDYNIKKTASKIRHNGALPKFEGERLFQGR